LITTGTICDIFKNQGGYLILAQSTGTENVFNPCFKYTKSIRVGITDGLKLISTTN
jgi:hypothetical protein